MKNASLAAAVAVLTLSALSTAHAEASIDPPSIVVRYADLDLSSTQGSATLYLRLKSAARLVCRNLEPEAGPLNMRAQRQGLHAACLNQALAGAVASIKLPAFSSYVASLTAPSTADYPQVAHK
jgi:UrcA family protein